MARFVRFSWKELALLALQVVLLVTLMQLQTEHKVYLRNVMFSEFVADSQATGPAAVERMLAKGFRVDAAPAAYRPYLNPRFERELAELKAQPTTADRDLAFGIATRLGDPRESRICGVESLGKVVFDTDSGQGCCSDFSKAWLFYANYLGLRAREVNNIGHTTVEYFDRQRGKWVWLDPFNKVKFVDEGEVPLSQREIRAMSLFDVAQVRRLPGSHADFDPRGYVGYQPREYAVVSWRRGVNFLEVEAWDARLRDWGLPKSLRQLVLLSTGIQPGWLVLATDPMAFYLRLLQGMLYAVLAFFVAEDVWIAWRVGAWWFRRRRKAAAQ